ncbi:MAG: glycosyltransferase family 2 protein, partial [Rhizobacter sp.]
PFYAPASRPPPQPEGDLCAEFVTGAAMLLDVQRLRALGGFDPWFFLYFEDDDLCLRVRRAGHAIVVAHAAHVLHRVRRSSAPSVRSTLRRYYCMTLSKLYLTRKVIGLRSCVAAALRAGFGSLVALPFALPFALFASRRERFYRHAARLAAALMAWMHLRRAHCLEPDR